MPFCLPGEDVSFKALKVRDKVCYGKLTEVRTISPDRVAPVCPVYEKCGGCQLQHASYSAQLSFKRQNVENCLKKIGGIDAEVSPAVFGKKEYRYRNKLALPVGKDAYGANAIGFYAPRSHRIIKISDCALQSEWASAYISAVYEFMRVSGADGYDEESGKGVIRHIVGREIKGKYILTVVATSYVDPSPLVKLLEKDFKRFTLLLNINNSKTNVIFGKEWHLCCGEGYFEGEDSGIKYRAGAKTFLQVNDEVRSSLYKAVVKAVCDEKAVAVDLYSGGGMLTAMLAKGCKAAYGIEIVAEAVECADRLKEMNGLEDKMFNICGAVEDKIGEVFAATEGLERVIVCDPPRKGMERSVVKAVLESGADKVVLVSCNPATLARDLGLLCGSLKEEDGQIFKNPSYIAGEMRGYYDIISVTPFDMFPQTKHVETLVVLQRKDV